MEKNKSIKKNKLIKKKINLKKSKKEKNKKEKNKKKEVNRHQNGLKYSKYAKKKMKLIKRNNKYFIKSVKLNYKFFITLFLITILFSILEKDEKNEKPFVFLKIYMGFFSLFLAIITSYKIHEFSHYSSFGNFFSYLFDNDYIEKKPKFKIIFLKNILFYFSNYILDFHAKYHHDSDINKKWFLILYEGLQNIFNCGGLIVLISYIFNLKFSILNKTYFLNYNIIILWALGYATYHLINYPLKEKEHSHENHHKEPFKNFGPDFLDVLFGTKYDLNNLDNMNDGVINLIFITVFLLLIRQFKQYIF